VSKLTLSVDDQVISRAKNYAKQSGVSISEMVENYLSAVAEPMEARHNAPILRSVRGILKKADIAEYREHLATKYR
jgi:hypothetical protein